MESADRILNLLTTHWKVITLHILGFTAGGYRIARWRTSGLRKVLHAHGEILDDLTARLNGLRVELEKTRDELSDERAEKMKLELLLIETKHTAALLVSAKEQLNIAQKKVVDLEERVKNLEAREKELLHQIKTNDR